MSNAIDDHAGLVIDRTAIVSAVGSVQVATSTDAYFAADSVGYRVTWRIGHAVPRPNRLGMFHRRRDRRAVAPQDRPFA